MALFMYLVAGYIAYIRKKRLESQDNFDESMLGDLNNAIATADYQVNFAKSSRYYLALVVGLSLTSLLEASSPWWVIALAALFFLITYLGAKWEYKMIYAAQKKDLRTMRDKLISMETDISGSASIDEMI